MTESPQSIEPAGIEEDIPEELSDLAMEIMVQGSTLGQGLHPATRREIRYLMRIMNAYYSNLIEGHNTRPRDIEAALQGRAEEAENRSLAEEAAAHVRVQEWIDDQADRGAMPIPTDLEFILEVHRRFYDGSPDEMRQIRRDNGELIVMTPGVMRQGGGQEVVVGEHIPPFAEKLPAFMAHYQMRYRGITAGATGKILGVPAAHHRLNYIHPFLDGNGRVSRLISHAMFRRSAAGANGLWSISRGLARGLDSREEYKVKMAMADRPRQGDRDGRGNLSMSCLVSFTKWFLQVALDQIQFTSHILELNTLNQRYLRAVDLHLADPRANELAATIMRLGELARGDAEIVLKTSERTARNTLKMLIDNGFITSDGPKTAVRISFPDVARASIFPGLFG